MNLIEQLGGYEAAKRYAESRNGADNTGVYDSLQAALLEYRRANNIFEVDDKFVFLNGDNTEIMNVQFVWDDAVWGGYCGEIPKKSEIRHATDAEIEARKRLEVV